MNISDQINKAKQVFDFCFADEHRESQFQIQLNYPSSAWNENSVDDIEEFFKADLISIYRNVSPVNITDNMGFSSVEKRVFDDIGFNNYIAYLDHQYNKASNKKVLTDCIEDFILEVQYSKAQSLGMPVEHRDATNKIPDSFEVEIKRWLLKKRRSAAMLNDTTPQIPNPAYPNLKIKEVALLLYYSGVSVTRQNADDLIMNYGHKSGESLYHDYIFFSDYKNRTSEGVSKQKMKNTAKSIENIIGLLNDESFKKRALTDLKSLRDSIDNYPS